VDCKALCTTVKKSDGSWLFYFNFSGDTTASTRSLLVNKGSVCINGVSLTVVNAGENDFSVAIIPYTFEYTNFSGIKTGDSVNIEFDLIGKYVVRYMEQIKIS
jgi:riboflavin synthase